MGADSQTAVTGRGGTVSYGGSTIARITQWTVNETMDSSSEWGDSDSNGYTVRAAGRRGATVDTEGKYDTGAADASDLFSPGDIATVVCGSDGAIDYTFTRALCSDFSMTVNIDTEEVIGWTASFGNDGVYSHA